MRLALSIFALLTLLGSTATAKQLHVDPVGGADSGDGSSGAPFKQLQQVIDAGLVAGGDTVLLHDGYHGALEIKGKQNSAPIVIAAAPGAKARLSRIAIINNSSRWTVRGLDISPSHAPTFKRQTMIDLDGEQLVVEDCLLRTVADASGWSAADWNGKACNGIGVGGTKNTVRNNHLKNVNFGISVGASHSLIAGNVVENFSGDGLRGLGDHSVFENNTIKNCYDVNDNHDDGFQSWSRGSDGKVGTGQVTGVVLRGNRFINYTDPAQPLRGPLQGIGMFDGTFVDWVIENNVIITDHWHGISLYGAKNCRVVNNTVIDLNTESPGPPWIKITNHKDGTPPSGCVVRNNIATAFTNASTGVAEDHNLKISMADLAKHFVDPAAHDLRLLPTSAAVDAGSSSQAPAIDIDGVSRPQGSAIDIGACEHTTGPVPGWPDSGVPPAPEPDAGTNNPPPAPEPDAGTNNPPPAPEPDGTNDPPPAPDPDAGTDDPPPTAAPIAGTNPDGGAPLPPEPEAEPDHYSATPSPPVGGELEVGCRLGPRGSAPWPLSLVLLAGWLVRRRRRR